MKLSGNRRKRRRRKRKVPPWKGIVAAFRMIGISIFFGIGLFLVTIGIEGMAHSSVFRVEKILWVGLQHMEENEMNDRFQSLIGKNIFQVNIQNIHRDLLSDQWIKAVTVKKYMPNHLMVFVVERKPASVQFHLGDKTDKWVDLSVAPLVIDAEGIILQEGGSYPSDLPRLIHVNQEAYKRALELWPLLGDHTGLFIDLLNPKDLLVYLTDEYGEKRIGLLHFGEGSYKESWGRFLAIEADLKKRGLSQWEIDLRVPGQAIVKAGVPEGKAVSDLPSKLHTFYKEKA